MSWLYLITENRQSIIEVKSKSLMRLCVIFGDEFGEKIVGNLINLSTFCRSCDLECEHCRQIYGSHAMDIYNVCEVPKELPTVLDEPEHYLPKRLPNCDVLVAAALHPDILLSLPGLMERSGVKALIVPIENRKWCPPGVRKQLEDKLSELGIEYAFPKPFCTLQPTGKPIIDGFISKYKVGKPKVEVTVEGGKIKDAKVVRSAPCGSTWFVAQKIKRCSVDQLEDKISKAHHAYPCTASMEVDPELKETPLHVAGFLIREAVKEAVRKDSAEKSNS